MVTTKRKDEMGPPGKTTRSARNTVDHHQTQGSRKIATKRVRLPALTMGHMDQDSIEDTFLVVHCSLASEQNTS